MTSHFVRRLAFWFLPTTLGLLAGSAGPLGADQNSVYSLEVACRQERQAGLALLQEALTVLPGELAGALRLERLGQAYCVRLGQAGESAGLEGDLALVREHFPGAVAIRTVLEPGRLVAKVDLEPDTAASPAAIPAAPTVAEQTVAPVSAGPVATEAAVAGPAVLARTHAQPAPVAAPIRLAATGPEAAKAAEVPNQGATAKPAPAPAQASAAKAEPAPEKPAAPAQKPDSPGASPGGLFSFDLSAPLPFWLRLALAGVIVVAGLWGWRALRRNRPVALPPDTEPEQDLVEDPPCLSEEDERHLQNNLGELAMAQGNLLSLSKGRPVKSIYITSCLNGEGKTQAAISLAHGLAINKARVLLVDGNPRAPVLSRRYRSTGVPGLCECLADSVPPPADMPRVTKYPNLHLMPFGGNGHGRPDLLKDNHLELFLEAYGKIYDYIIMDGHSLTGSDTNIVACKFDGILMAVQCCRTKWEMVKQASQKMTLMGGSVLGVILNKRQYYIPNFIYKSL